MSATSLDPKRFVTTLDDSSPPDEPPWNPSTCGDIEMEIATDGTWYYHGSPIGRKPLVKLFSRVLRREADGEYYLVTPVEKCRIQVHDAPFVAVEVRATGRGDSRRLTFRTNVDDEVLADETHPIRVEHDADSGEPRPYLRVRGRLDALISRSVFYELVELGAEEKVDGEKLFGVWSSGTFFPLGNLIE